MSISPFNDSVAEFFGIAWPDASAVRVVFMADHANRFSAIGARLAVCGADDANALHCAAIAAAMPG